ncbi:MAG: F0F1 ATP synthase subunit B [Ruminococcus sp.]|nr:F0F1 ATP synthase subunit B [Ruminococcus sp.]
MLDFDIWTILFSVINILVLFFFLKKFLFGRVNAMLEKRAQMVQDDLDQAKQSAADAAALKSDYEQTLVGAKQEVRDILSAAEQRSRAQSNEITMQARQQADAILREAQKEIERERQRTLDGIQGEIADLALAAASKLMEQQVNDETNRALVNEFLTEEGVGE